MTEREKTTTTTTTTTTATTKVQNRKPDLIQIIIIIIFSSQFATFSAVRLPWPSRALAGCEPVWPSGKALGW